MAAQTGIKITSDTSEFKKSLEEGKKATKSFRQELREAKKNALDLTAEFRSLSDEMKNSDYGRSLQAQMQGAIKKAGELQDTMSDVSQEIKNFASDTQFADGMRLMTSTIGNLGTALVALTGNSENMKKVLMDIAKIQATVQAIKSLTDAFQKQNRVLLKNPYMLVAAGIAAVGFAIYEYMNNAKDATPATEDLTNEVENLGDAFDRLNTNKFLSLTREELIEYIQLEAKIEVILAKLRQTLRDKSNADAKYTLGDLTYNSDISELQKAYNRINELNGKDNKKRKSKEPDVLPDPVKIKMEADQIEREITDIAKLKDNVFSFRPQEDIQAPAPQDYELIGKYDKLDDGLDIISAPFLERIKKLGEDAKEKFVEGMKNGQSPTDALLGAEDFQKNIIDRHKRLKEIGEDLDFIGDVAGSVGSAFSSLGQAFEVPALNIAGVVAQAVAQIALAFGSALAADGSTKSNIFAFIGAAVASVATLATLVAQVKNITGFAEGGIIRGATTIGDYNLARVNDGEMILNNRQQTHLFSMLNDGIVRPSLEPQSGKVEFEIQGQRLVGVLSNYNKKMKKVY